MWRQGYKDRQCTGSLIMWRQGYKDKQFTNYKKSYQYHSFKFYILKGTYLLNLSITQRLTKQLKLINKKHKNLYMTEV